MHYGPHYHRQRSFTINARTKDSGTFAFTRANITLPLSMLLCLIIDLPSICEIFIYCLLCIARQMGHCMGGNFNIHIWAWSASPSVQVGRL